MSSTFSSFIPNYSETSILDNIAQLAESLGKQQYGWAAQQFANSSALTDQVVNNFLTASQKNMDLANNMTNRYTNVFQPQEDSLIRDANTYASDARKRLEMGMAESDQARASDAAKANLEQTLRSQGIDPSSGRYAELEAAQNAQRNAAAALAGQQARQNVEQTGRNLRTQAIQVGQQYPGQIVNSLNSAMQGFAGAENAKLSNINTGVNAFGNADKFLNTGMADKFPPLGSQGSRGTILNTTGRDASSNGPGGVHNMGNLGTSPGGMDNFSFGDSGMGPDTAAMDSYGGSTPGGGFSFAGGYPGAGITNVDQPSDTGFGASSFDESGFTDAYGDQTSNQGFDESGFTDAYGPQSAASTDNSYVPDYSSSYVDSGGGYTGDYGGGDSSYTDESSYYGDYAAGGAIPENGPTTGGVVPPQASPSMGAQTDDVNAHVNVGEFIIPRDVAMWKGQEFFQNLIDKSRKARSGAPAKGKPSFRPTNGPPSFVSHAMR